MRNRYFYMFQQTFRMVKFLQSYNAREKSCSYLPVIVLVEPTNDCNLKCQMCIRHKMTRPKGYMAFEFYKNMLSNGPHINRIVFCGLGEPLLHPDITKMISYASDKNIRTEVNTNAVLLTEGKSKEIIQSGLDSISFSFEGLDSEKYEKIRQGAKYELVLNNIISFLKIREKYANRKIIATIDCIDFNYLTQQKVNFKRKVLAWGFDSVNFLPLHNWPKKNERKLFCRERNNGYYRCIFPWLMVAVLWDGRVVACCDDFNGDNVIGKISKDISISSVWNSEVMVSLREKLLQGRTSGLICHNCPRMKKNPWLYPFSGRIKRELRELFFNSVKKRKVDIKT